jgi:hypothetical protein
MNKRPGHVDVTTEVGYCNFCQRTRNLRTEAHHLGTLVRTIVTCESCHRTLSSTMGVAQPEAVAPLEPEPQPAAEPGAAAPKPAPARRAATAAKKAAAATAKKPAPAAKKPAPAAEKPAASTKAKTPARRTSTKK